MGPAKAGASWRAPASRSGPVNPGYALGLAAGVAPGKRADHAASAVGALKKRVDVGVPDPGLRQVGHVAHSSVQPALDRGKPLLASVAGDELGGSVVYTGNA